MEIHTQNSLNEWKYRHTKCDQLMKEDFRGEKINKNVTLKNVICLGKLYN